MNRFNCTNTIL